MGNTNNTKVSGVGNASSDANATSVGNASSDANATSVGNASSVATDTSVPHISLCGMQMDDANRDALKVWKESGSVAFVKHCFNPT